MSFKKSLACIALAFGAATAVPASAAVLSIAGDADCFGLGGTCPDGTLWRDELGGVFFNDYSSPGEAPFTDIWFAETGPSYNLAYSGGTNVFVELKTAGIADNRGPWTVLLNGFFLGSITTNTSPNSFQEVRTFSFAVAPGLLQANNVVSFTTNGGDGYSIDYAALVGDRAGGVPEPAAWALMLAGFGMVGSAMRRRGSRAALA